MADRRPNILFIMTDDHAAHAMSCYGSRVNETPHLDRIAAGGMRFDNCFCTNSICTPSRAAILCGTYNHVNGVTTLETHMDNRLTTFPKLLQAAGYQTAVFGKWHLGQGPAHEPAGFDAWSVLPGQGLYHDPEFIGPDGKQVVPGYATDIITDRSIDWIQNRDPDRPFCLLTHHKAPHRPWEPDEPHARMCEDVEIPYPETFDDDYATRAAAAAAATMRIERDLNETDLKGAPPPGLDADGEKCWKYQRYIKDYLRCIASVDDNVGRLLEALDAEGLAEDTVVVYTSDQGFFLGDHGWFDKRFMYEESLRMPFVIRYPRVVAPGSTCRDMILNVDFAQTFLDLAGVDAPDEMQGRSFRPLLQGERPADWQTAMYYRYWMHGSHHNVYAHYGVRTERYKLIYYYAHPLDAVPVEEWTARSNDHQDFAAHPPEWELFDLQEDGHELRNVYTDPAYAEVRDRLVAELDRLQKAVGDEPFDPDAWPAPR